MMKSIATLLAAAVLTVACANVPSDDPRGAAKFADDPRLGEKVDKICFSRTIDGFSQADRDTVVLRKGVRQHYLVEVLGPCSSLRNAQSIGIDSHLSCITKNDYLIVSTSAFSLNNGSIGPNRCMISAIYAWDKDTETVEQSE